MADDPADIAYEQDVAYVGILLTNLEEALGAAGMSTSGDEQMSIKIRCYTRSGYPIEVER